ncbi:molecular chaperone DnaJ [Zhenpiania hominis]|uniref:Molecular chaperone DnaJ n=1 Tax=Zhenpiania hominis TaxID=2763644 RepID=A0A923SP80_9FIRM|nr:molecular chaperone DnaJ [Zhenpiania hominis]MBC6678282.1 molecular chaperone DnaJ [Zhenpiania hominis]
MANGIFFKGIGTLEDLKRQYRTLALQNHPDRGGDVEVMKAINNEYDKLFAQVKDTHKNKEGETYTKENPETAEEFKDIIDKLIKMQGVEIEVIGCFIWLSGNTKEHKEAIKALGFRWHSKKKMWYKAPEGYKRWGKKEYSMNEIRGMYGTSGKFHGEEDKTLKLGA